MCHQKRISRLFCAAIASYLALCSTSLSADSRGYAGLSYAVFDVDLNDINYHPKQVGLFAGYTVFKGISLEVNLRTEAGSAERKDLSLEVERYEEVAIRWQSPEESGIRAYLVTGLGRLKLHGQLENSPYPGSEYFSGPVAGIGLLTRLSRQSHWNLGINYKHYFFEDDMTSESVSLVLHYDF